jgi:two-component system, response regulator YesN
MLKDTSLKNYQVSQRVGFENSNYFNKLFKHNTGMTPSEFKNL